MEIKRKAKNLRDKLQQGIYKIINSSFGFRL